MRHGPEPGDKNKDRSPELLQKSVVKTSKRPNCDYLYWKDALKMKGKEPTGGLGADEVKADGVLCVHSDIRVVPARQGDSGGPLICKSKRAGEADVWVVAGVCSLVFEDNENSYDCKEDEQGPVRNNVLLRDVA